MKTASRYGNCRADELMEMPRAFSMSIQSDTVERRPAFPRIAPASKIACACSDKASVSVDFPASGWLMTANVRRWAAWLATSDALAVSWLSLMGADCGAVCGPAVTILTSTS